MAEVGTFELQHFMARLKGGARPNQFFVDLALPQALQGAIIGGTAAEDKMRFMCKATSMPASTIGEVAVPFRGAEFNIAGDRTFADWTVTVLNDVDFLIKDAMEQWSDNIVGHVDRDEFGQGVPLDYMASGEVNQLSRNGIILKTYKIIGIWPSNVGEITVDWSTNDAIEEFETTFKVQWWESNTTRNNTNNEPTAATGSVI